MHGNFLAAEPCRWKVDFTEENLLSFVKKTDDFIHKAHDELLPGQMLWEYKDIWCPDEFKVS